jgi:hypothetical protein
MASITLPYLKHGVSDTLRIEVIRTPTDDTVITVRVNNEIQIVYTDIGGFDSGGIGFTTAGDSVSLEHVEVFTLPVDVDRIGPNP